MTAALSVSLFLINVYVDRVPLKSERHVGKSVYFLHVCAKLRSCCRLESQIEMLCTVILKCILV